MQKNFRMLINELLFLQPLILWRLVRVVEGARLESVYTSKGYRGFESLSLRFIKKAQLKKPGFLCVWCSRIVATGNVVQAVRRNGRCYEIQKHGSKHINTICSESLIYDLLR